MLIMSMYCYDDIRIEPIHTIENNIHQKIITTEGFTTLTICYVDCSVELLIVDIL